ncbi:transposable element Tcb1 transposase [Trichonephila clavipes]|nr:transposable element Tcb1 transposase [Trichonephila clavipes]
MIIIWVDNSEKQLEHPGNVSPVFTKEGNLMEENKDHSDISELLLLCFLKEEYINCEERGKQNIPFQVFQKNELSTLLRGGSSFLTPRISLEFLARRWDPANGFLTAIGCWTDLSFLYTAYNAGRSHPPQCIPSLEGRQIVRLAVTDCSLRSRTVTQHIEPVTHQSVSARTIRRRLQQSNLSARRPLPGLPLTQNHRRLHRQWCGERRMWVAEWNEVVFNDESRICLHPHDGRIRVWRHHGERMLNSCVMHWHTGPAPGIMV